MGVTIKSLNCRIDLGYGGFLRLRKTVAELCCEEIKNHYFYLLDNRGQLSKEELDEYVKKTEKIYNKYKKTHGKVMKFLYAPDTDAELPYGVAKQLLSIIGNYDNKEIYGYAGWGDEAARFKDFKEILQDCADNKCKLYWD